MAQIREELALIDKFSAQFTKFIAMAEKASGAVQDVRGSLANIETAAASAALNMDRLAGEMQEFISRSGQAQAAGSSLMGTLRQIGGVIGGMQAAKWLVNTSDQISQIDARLKRMTGSAEAAAQAQEEIYAAAMRSRGSYLNMANLVSQLGTMAGDAFGDTGELISFAEQVNKQIALSGASSQAAEAAVYQLSQGLSSGALRGEELNSVLEQTPAIAQTIAEYMGVSVGEMRELASDGAVTAEVVKNAMLSAAAETNAAFAETPLTWAQVWTMAQNIVIQALDPVLQAISWVANNLEIIGPIVLGVAAAIGVFALAANAATIATNVWTAAQHALNAAMQMNPIVWIIDLVVLLIAIIFAVVAAVNKATGESYSALGIIAGAVMTVVAVIANTVIGLLNGIIQLIWSIFVEPFLGIIEFVINAANGGFDSFGDAVANLIGNIISWFLSLGKVVTKIIDAIFGTDWTAGLTSLQDSVRAWGKNENAITADLSAPEIEYRMAYGDAWNAGYNWGANLFSGSDSVSSFLDDFPDIPDYSPDLSSIASDTSDIKKAVSLSEEDLAMLADMAERRYVNNINLTSQSPVITIQGANTGDTEADRRGLADAIKRILLEQAASATTNAYAVT